MEYTIKKLGHLAGISTRTLRYYDEIGLLKPARVNTSGYRIYGQAEIDKLQHILFYKELGVELERIKEIFSVSGYDELQALYEHKEKLTQKRKQLDKLILNVNKTIEQRVGGTNMSDIEKFEGFKQDLIQKNEQLYGDEIRAKYGEKSVDKSYAKLKNLTKQQYEEVENLGNAVLETLYQAYKTGDEARDLAQKAADLHRQRLSYYWDSYTKEAHRDIANMYVDDKRFTSFYDKHQPGAAVFLRDAILIYTSNQD